MGKTLFRDTLIAFACLGIILALELAYRDPLFQKSLTVIPQFQGSNPSESTITFWEIYTDFGLAVTAVCIPLYYLLVSDHKPRAAYYLVLLVGIVLLQNSFYKMAYADPRPFWVSTDFQSFYCSEEFGNPSGHSMLVSSFAVTPCLDILTTKMKDSVIWKKILLVVLTIVYMLSIGYSRLFLGAHTMNQVLFGLLIGSWTGFFLEFCCKDIFLDHIQKLITCNKEVSNRKKIYAVRATALATVGIILVVVCYAIVSSTMEIPIEWEQNFIAQCGEFDADTAYYKDSMIGSGMFMAGFGSYYGILLQNQCFNGQCNFAMPKGYGLLKAILRLLVFILIMLPFLVVNMVLKYDHIPSVIGLMIVKTLLPMLIGCMILFGFGDQLCFKLKLYDKRSDDHFKTNVEMAAAKKDDSSV